MFIIKCFNSLEDQELGSEIKGLDQALETLKKRMMALQTLPAGAKIEITYKPTSLRNMAEEARRGETEEGGFGGD